MLQGQDSPENISEQMVPARRYPSLLPRPATVAAVGVGDGLRSCWHWAPLGGRKRVRHMKSYQLSDLPLC